jgi:hypothetical protein
MSVGISVDTSTFSQAHICGNLTKRTWRKVFHNSLAKTGAVELRYDKWSLSAMKLCAAFILTALVTLLNAGSVAEDEQSNARALLERARELSDIRSPSAPAFRLKVTFTAITRDLTTLEGTYTEIWVSNTQWRRETVVGASRRIEVGWATRHWLLNSGPPLPDEVQRFSSLLELSPSWWQEFTFQPTTDHDVNGVAIRCVVTPAGENDERYALCFYKQSGLLMQTTMPKRIGNRLGDYSCLYANYQKFWEYFFPRELRCLQEGHRKLEGKMVELSLDPFPDPALFVPPAGATEIGNGTEHPTPPRRVPEPDLRFPF